MNDYKILIIATIALSAIAITTIAYLETQKDPEKQYEPLKKIPLDKNIYSEENKITIFDDTYKNDNMRLNIEPHDLIMNLTESNLVTFENESSFTAKIFVSKQNHFDLKKPSEDVIIFDSIAPGSFGSMKINQTDFFNVLVQTSKQGEGGAIVAISDKTNDLPEYTKAKMVMSILLGNVPNVVGVGIKGSPEVGVFVTVLGSELEKHHDTESYYQELIKEKLPFDMPVQIEFLTGKDMVIK